MDQFVLLNPCFHLAGILRIGLLFHDVLRQGIEVLFLDVVVVRDALGCPLQYPAL
jgi:hypothetical protein